MTVKSLKTTQAKLDANKRYLDKRDRVNVMFPAGTIERMKKVGIAENNKSTFIKYAVELVLAEMEKELEVEMDPPKKEMEKATRNRLEAYQKYRLQMEENQKNSRKKQL